MRPSWMTWVGSKSSDECLDKREIHRREDEVKVEAEIVAMRPPVQECQGSTYNWKRQETNSPQSPAKGCP